MLKKVTASLLTTSVMMSSLALGAATPDFDFSKFKDIEEVITDQRTTDFIARVTVDGKVDQSLVEKELALSSGEEETWWPAILGALIGLFGKGCENSSYRDKDRCVGKCDDWKARDMAACRGESVDRSGESKFDAQGRRRK